MKKTKPEALATVLKWLLRITMAAGIFVTVFLNRILQTYYTWGDALTDERRYIFLTGALTPAGICCLVILWQLISIVKTISQRDPFVAKNIRCFRLIAVACFLISVCFTVLFSQYPSAFTFALGYVFVVMGLASLVFGKLFQKAVDYKNENDLTI